MLEGVPIWLVIVAVVLIIAAINLAVWLFGRATSRKVGPGRRDGNDGSDFGSSSGL